jgi:hypothetical protein
MNARKIMQDHANGKRVPCYGCSRVSVGIFQRSTGPIPVCAECSAIYAAGLWDTLTTHTHKGTTCK